jgi:hypothetical protein
VEQARKVVEICEHILQHGAVEALSCASTTRASSSRWPAASPPSSPPAPGPAKSTRPW